MVEYMKRFRNAVSDVADFVESKNTPGSGLRWAQKIVDKIEYIATLKIEHPICRNSSRARIAAFRSLLMSSNNIY